MKKIKIYDKYFSERKPPVNLKKSDLNLFSHEFNKEIPESHVLIEKNIYVINDSLISLKKLKFYSSYIYFYPPAYKKIIKDVLRNFLRSKSGVEEIEKGIWISDNKSAVYFHWLCDALGKYYLIPDKFLDAIVLIPKKYEISWIVEFLESLSIEYKILEEGKRYKVNKMILPSYPAPSGNFNNKNINDVSRNIITSCHKNKPPIGVGVKRIWISRESARRKVTNKKTIEPVLKKHNFQDYVLEDLSLSEKVELFQSAEIIAASHGSGLTNMIFMKEGTNLIDIRDPKDNIKNAFFSLASEFNLNYFYMEREETNDETIIINPEKLDHLISSICND